MRHLTRRVYPKHVTKVFAPVKGIPQTNLLHLIHGDSMVRKLHFERNSSWVIVMCHPGGRYSEEKELEIIEDVSWVQTFFPGYRFHLILHFGTNNIGGRQPRLRDTPEEFVRLLTSSLKYIRSAHPELYITISGLIPRNDVMIPIKTTNLLLKNGISPLNPLVVFLDHTSLFLLKIKDSQGNKKRNDALFARDDLHLNSEGNKLFAEKVLVAMKNRRIPGVVRL